MPVLDIDAVLDQLPLIGLISRDQYREAKAEAEDDSSDAIVRSLMRKGWLTSWQLERLKKGDTSSFFYGEYRALFHLAEGTFARVYRGERVDSGSPVAIKVLRNRFATSPEAVAAFHKEAEAGMRLRHPNIVRITDSGQIDDRHFMVMEYVEGSNLRELLRLRTRFKGREALPLMLGLAEGMTYSHNQGVTHRDIKATNILISNSGAAKLVDFGLAAIDDAGGKGGMQSQRTVDYSALERTCGSAKGDPRSDIFFLGCVFYHMLTGHVAMEDSESKDPLKKMLKRSFGVIKPISEHAHAPDPALSRIIEKMMRVDLASRYQTMAEVSADLKAWSDVLAGKVAVVEKKTDDEDDSLDDLLKLDSSIFQHSYRDEDEPEKADPEPVQNAPQPETETVLEAEPEPEAKPEPPPAPPTRPEPSSRTTILCVEAQAEIQEALRKALSRLGYRVLLFSDPEAAVDRYRESPSDIVLFDFDGQNANDAVPALAALHAKAEEDGRPFWALILLGPRQDSLRERLPKADRLAVLSKPVKLKQVQEALADLVLGE